MDRRLLSPSSGERRSASRGGRAIDAGPARGRGLRDESEEDRRGVKSRQRGKDRGGIHADDVDRAGRRGRDAAVGRGLCLGGRSVAAARMRVAAFRDGGPRPGVRVAQRESQSGQEGGEFARHA